MVLTKKDLTKLPAKYILKDDLNKMRDSLCHDMQKMRDCLHNKILETRESLRNELRETHDILYNMIEEMKDDLIDFKDYAVGMHREYKEEFPVLRNIVFEDRERIERIEEKVFAGKSGSN